MPKDSDVLMDESGKCPKCGMLLKPVRIVLAYSCLNNTAFIQDIPGKCRTDNSELVPIAASVFWVCSNTPDKHELEPGRCADGSDRVKRFEPRPHGDHNPRHGGQFFMADDAWHHVEGTYPEAGLFRIFFYDDWTKPLETKGFTGRAIIRDLSGKELTAIPLGKSRVANAMEARIPNASLPLFASIRVRFEPQEREKLFDFQFPEYSQEPAPAPAELIASARTPVNAAPTVVKVKDQPAGTDDQPAPPVSVGTVSPYATPPIVSREDPIPLTSKEILAELTAKSEQLADEIENGAPLGQLWVPALRSKNLAMALINDHLTEIPPLERVAAENAAGRLVRAAFAIDNLADLGDREKVLSAHDVFASAASDLRNAYATIH
jgi:hypothetical protein